MVAVYCLREDAAAQSLRDALFTAGIPCALVGPTYGPASIVHKVPFVLFAQSAAVFGEGLRRRLPRECLLSMPDTLQASETALMIEAAYLRRFSTDYADARADGIRFVSGDVYFRGHFLPLTAAENRILRLLFHSRGTYFCAEEIAAACLADPGSGVAVHICNINQKARRSALYAVIESRRYSGYRIL